jgi:predicted kinase
MTKPKLIFCVGLPASGKTSYAKEYVKNHNNTMRLSSDEIRKQLYGDESIQGSHEEVFGLMRRQAKEALLQGINVVWDSTNINYKRRMDFIKQLHKIPCEKICVLMATPYKECIKNNLSRDRQVPVDVIKRMYKNFHIPYWYEGWDDIQIEYSEDSKGKSGSPILWMQEMKTYDQQNYHHTFTLGEHCEKTWAYVCKHQKSNGKDCLPLRIASILHDCGKVRTKSFYNGKGELDRDAHYYNHQYVGAYDSLFFNTVDFPINYAIRIMWHMQMYCIENNQKALDKYKKLWGEELYNDLALLHEADKQAH